jgi:hypothetical protein
MLLVVPHLLGNVMCALEDGASAHNIFHNFRLQLSLVIDTQLASKRCGRLPHGGVSWRTLLQKLVDLFESET